MAGAGGRRLNARPPVYLNGAPRLAGHSTAGR